MPFRLNIVGTEDYWINDATGQYAQFEDGAAAQEYAKSVMADSSIKLRVKRVVDDGWKDREGRKFQTGTYKHLPWASDDWFNHPHAWAIHRFQFAHPSKTNPGMIAYTESPEKGMDDIRTQIKPGKWLAQFDALFQRYGISLKTLEQQFKNIYEPRELFWARTADEIQWVYENGPESCMSTKEYRKKHNWGYNYAGDWPDNIHATRMYAHESGDLAVVYLTKGDKAGARVQSRALVFEAKKTHSRIYGEIAALKYHLENLGYKPAPPIGARLCRHIITSTEKHGPSGWKFLVPYCDAGQNSGEGSLMVRDKKTHLVIEGKGARNGVYGTGNTSGASTTLVGELGHEQPDQCQSCGDDIGDCGELSRIYRGPDRNDFRWWCDGCADDTTFYCERTERVYDASRVPQYEMANGSTWSEWAFENYGFVCEGNGRNYPREQRVTLMSGARWSNEYFEENGFTCEYTGDPESMENSVEMADGSLWSRTAFEDNGFHCPECERNLRRSQRAGRRSICQSCRDEQVAEQQSEPALTSSAEERITP